MNSSDGVDEMDVASLAEAYDLECKAAQGRDGRGERQTMCGKATAPWPMPMVG